MQILSQLRNQSIAQIWPEFGHRHSCHQQKSFFCSTNLSSLNLNMLSFITTWKEWPQRMKMKILKSPYISQQQAWKLICYICIIHKCLTWFNISLYMHSSIVSYVTWWPQVRLKSAATYIKYNFADWDWEVNWECYQTRPKSAPIILWFLFLNIFYWICFRHCSLNIKE